MTAASLLKARAVLVQHGIDPDADVDELAALLEVRGWQISLGQVMGRGRGQVPRWSRQATLAAPPESPVLHRPTHVSVTGSDNREVLTRLLAKVLEKERKA